ncbi:unnamed protein product [Musa textilis]
MIIMKTKQIIGVKLLGVQESIESLKDRRKCCLNQSRKNRGLAEGFESSSEVRGAHRESSEACPRFVKLATSPGACWEFVGRNPRVRRKSAKSSVESLPEEDLTLPVVNLHRIMFQFSS